MSAAIAGAPQNAAAAMPARRIFFIAHPCEYALFSIWKNIRRRSQSVRGKFLSLGWIFWECDINPTRENERRIKCLKAAQGATIEAAQSKSPGRREAHF